tara:strand:- start:306 stop:530 length:225 start_codon:yes stop_codon:yes gene_type:complete
MTTETEGSEIPFAPDTAEEKRQRWIGRRNEVQVQIQELTQEFHQLTGAIAGLNEVIGPPNGVAESAEETVSGDA